MPRSRFGDTRTGTVIDPWIDDSSVETVPLDLSIRRPQQHAHLVNQPSTSTGRKRKSSSTSRTVNIKRHKTVTTAGKNKYQCKSPGCGKSFRDVFNLSQHERIHLGIKPFSCTWPDCGYSAAAKSHVVRHVRIMHFKLPALQKEQAQLNIVDNRNPKVYVLVDQELLERRLE